MFGHPCGPVREMPENTTPIFKMVLVRPAFAVSGDRGEPISKRGELTTICEFEWTGKFESFSGVRVYYLTDIYKA